MNVAQLTIQMAADVARLRTDMDSARRTVEGATGQMQRAANQAMNSIKGLAGAFIGFQGAQALVQAADSVTALGNKLKLATKDANEAAKAYTGILEIANRSKVSFTELGNTYAAISRNTQQLGISQDRLFKVTESIANAMTVSGGSAESMKAALVQLGQGMASGTLRGEELNSVMEQTPRLAQALADGMGITIGQLREMGKEGRITSQTVIEALESQYDKLKKEVGESAITISQSFQVLKNSSIDFVGSLDAANGTSSVLADTILMLGKTVSDFALILRSIGVASKDASQDLGILTAIQNGLATVFETVAVIGVNLKFVLVSIGKEIGGIAAQAAAVLTGNFSEAVSIGKLMKEDAVAARAEVDQQTAAILNARKIRDSLINAESYNEPKFAKMLAKETSELKKQVPEVKKATEVKFKLSEAQKFLNKETEDFFEAEEKSRQAVEKSIRSGREMVEQMEFENSLLGLTNEERELSIKLRALENSGLKKGTEAYRLFAERVEQAISVEKRFKDQQDKERADAKAAQDILDANLRASRKTQEEWQRASDKIKDSITDALMRGFESGKGFAQNLKDTVINMFKTLVLRPVIQGIVGGVTGFGVSSAGASGVEGFASNMAQQYITSAIGGSILGSSAAYGAAIGTTSVAAGSQAAMLAAQTGSFGAAGLSATASAAGTGSSMMASAAAAGPYVLAAIVALNALGVFRSNKIVGGGLAGTLGAGDLTQYDLNRKGGSLFTGPDYRVQNERATEQTMALEQAFISIRSGTAQMARELGLSTEQVESFTMAVGDVQVHPDIDKLGLVLDGLTDDQKLAKINEVLTKSGNAMAELVLGAGATAQQLAQLYTAVMQERSGLELQLLQAQGNVTEIRKRERDALHESNRALYDQIKALEDQKTAIQESARVAKEAWDTSRSNTDAAYAALERAVNAQKRAAEITRDAARDQITSIRSVMDVLGEGIRSLFAGTREAAFQGMSFIDRALSTARSTGYLPDSQQLQQAIFSATQGISNKSFATKSDQIEAQRMLAFKLKDLQELAGEQLTEAEKQLLLAEKQLKNLDGILESARAQIDVLRGIDLSVKSVESAINQLNFALSSEKSIKNLTEQKPVMPPSYDQNYVNQLLNEARQQAGGAGGTLSYLDVVNAGTNLGIPMSMIDAAVNSVNFITRARGGYTPAGLTLVGEQGPELVNFHQPSMIYTAAQTQGLLGGGFSDEIRALREEVVMLRAEARATAINTGRTQDIMKRVTRNGEAMTVMTDGEALEVTTP